MKTVIEMAKEAGFGGYAYEAQGLFEAFVDVTRADERDACAKLADDESMSRREIAAAIRARGNK